MEHEQILQRHGMINDGLKRICNNYLKYYQRKDNMDEFRTQIASLQNIQLGGREQQFFFNINSAIIVKWLIQSLSRQIEGKLFKSQSEKDVIITILRMVQTSRFVKAHKIVPRISQHNLTVQKMLQNCHSQYSVWSDKIKSQRQQCSMLSQNINTIKCLILAQRKQIRQNSSNLLNKITLIDLNSLFLNTLLNLKRTLKKINDDLVNLNQITSANLKKLKTVQLYIHYLWATNFTRTQPFIKQVREDSNPDRKKTYIYLLYDKEGANKINKYVEQGSFIQLKNDIEFITQKIQNAIQK